MAVAVAFAFLAACGFASGNVLVRVGTEKVPAPTATLLTVFSGIILIVGLTLALRLDEISSLSIEALGWILVLGILGYPMARLFIITLFCIHVLFCNWGFCNCGFSTFWAFCKNLLN